MKKSESNKIFDLQLKEWSKRNRDPGVLPCIPIILISSLCGDKAGITMNMVQQVPLSDIGRILKAASDQVEAKIKELEAN